MTTVKENLIAARALIDTPEKWGKGRGSFTYYGSKETCVACAHEAIRRVVGQASWDRSSVPEVDALEFALPTDEHTTPDYNDLPETTHADIMALFDRAIAAEKAQDATL